MNVMSISLKHFEIREGVRGGKLVVKGTRVALEDILDMIKAGWKPKEIAEELEIPEEAVHEAIKLALEELTKIHEEREWE